MTKTMKIWELSRFPYNEIRRQPVFFTDVKGDVRLVLISDDAWRDILLTLHQAQRHLDKQLAGYDVMKALSWECDTVPVSKIRERPNIALEFDGDIPVIITHWGDNVAYMFRKDKYDEMLEEVAAIKKANEEDAKLTEEILLKLFRGDSDADDHA